MILIQMTDFLITNYFNDLKQISEIFLEFPQKINQSGNNDNWKVS